MQGNAKTPLVPAATVDELRLLLRKKFPGAHPARLEPQPPPEIRPRFSDPSTFPAGAISEIVPEGPLPILGLLIAEILGEPACPNEIPDFVLVDGDGFDPGSFSDPACSRLLWVRCPDAGTMLKAADLVIRDGNIPFVLLDVCNFPPSELRALPDSSWWRLKQLAEANGCRVLALSPFPLVPCATLRLALSSTFTLDDFERPRAELSGEIHIHARRLRRAT